MGWVRLREWTIGTDFYTCMWLSSCNVFHIKSPIDCQILLDDLNSLAQWETDWQMKFNVAKCHSMRVTWHLPDKHILFDYTLHDQQKIEQAQSAKFLRITITDNLGVNMFRKFHARQLRQRVFSGAV